MFVKIGRIPGTPTEIEITEGMTVEQAIRAANLDYSGYTVLLNGSETELDVRVTNGDLIMLVKRIKGNA